MSISSFVLRLQRAVYMIDDMCWLSPSLCACLRCRTLIGIYLPCGFVRAAWAVLCLCYACGTAMQ